jgi:hypothetical protein
MTEESYATSLAYSDYEGWVAYTAEGPIFERVPFSQASAKGGYGLAQPIPGAVLPTTREADRNTVEWRDLPHDKILRVELYWARHRVEPSRQPVVRLDRPVGMNVRFFQFKTGGVLIQGGQSSGVPVSHNVFKDLSRGQERTGIIAWTVGYWDKDNGEAKLVEVTKTEIIQRGPVCHPCWPTPYGFGLSPQAVGITEADVPSMGV